MVDREKVIAGLECHRVFNCEIDAYTKTMCPYWDYEECSQTLMADALELLKEQEPVKPIYTTDPENIPTKCAICGNRLDTQMWQYCPFCGTEVKWDE